MYESKKGKGYELYKNFNGVDLCDPTNDIWETRYIRVLTEKGLKNLHYRAEVDDSLVSITTMGEWAYNMLTDLYEPLRTECDDKIKTCKNFSKILKTHFSTLLR